jgi:hypothetical protein
MEECIRARNKLFSIDAVLARLHCIFCQVGRLKYIRSDKMLERSDARPYHQSLLLKTFIHSLAGLDHLARPQLE